MSGVKCIVHGCQNHTHQGKFVGDLCMPCHIMLTTGRRNPSNAWFEVELAQKDAELAMLKARLKQIGELADS